MAKFNYQKLSDSRRVRIGGAIYGGPQPFNDYKYDNYELNYIDRKPVHTPLKGQARRNQEINALLSKSNRNSNQEKRLQSLLKLNSKNC